MQRKTENEAINQFAFENNINTLTLEGLQEAHRGVVKKLPQVFGVKTEAQQLRRKNRT